MSSNWWLCLQNDNLCSGNFFERFNNVAYDPFWRICNDAWKCPSALDSIPSSRQPLQLPLKTTTVSKSAGNPPSSQWNGFNLPPSWLAPEQSDSLGGPTIQSNGSPLLLAPASKITVCQHACPFECRAYIASCHFLPFSYDTFWFCRTVTDSDATMLVECNGENLASLHISFSLWHRGIWQLKLDASAFLSEQNASFPLSSKGVASRNVLPRKTDFIFYFPKGYFTGTLPFVMLF